MSQAMNMMTDMAMQSARHSNLDTEKSRLNALSNSQDQALKEKELRKAAEGFEAIFIQKMWDEMRSSLPKNGMHYSKEEEYWQSMYSQELGKSMASAGGIGLADMMVEQLTRPAGTPQTGALSRIRMAVKPAPLLPEENAKTAAQDVSLEAKAETAGRQNPVKPVNTAQLYEEYSVTPQEASAQNTAEAPAQERAAQTQNQAKEEQQAQIIRTTYTTNLPPEKREHAILDKKGNPIKKYQESPRTTEVKAPTREDYFDRSASIARTFKVAEPTVQTGTNQETPIRQPEQKPEQNARQAVSGQEIQSQGIGQSMQNDILAGISTTYIPYQQRRAMILASGGQKPDTQIQVAENTKPAQAETEQIKPAFKLPSLEDALRMGTLVASLSPQEEAQIQEMQAKKQTGQGMETATHIGGGTIISTPPVFENVSAKPLENEFQMPAAGSISSSFGWRFDPVNKQRAWHTGLDIQAKHGSAVTASGTGIVKFAGQDRELGNMIIIDHGNGVESVYGHNSELLVKAGDTINSGTQIAKVGSSGRTNGSHLHFEIRQNGLSINPEPYFAKEEIS